ncbi:MAG: hypothetical protein A2Y12_00550 [Planctomycetes bacterium GWF2_42_9]|nr:MAG: hypothetical protein A2Y12_00550 [Planctomycetes bacterium GWF2_42_9]
MLALNENPPLTWPDKRIRDFNGKWYVAHCKSRNEKILAWHMTHKNINYFLPMRLNVRKHKNKTFRTLLPVFTGYIFFCGGEQQRLEILRTNRVANMIEVQNQEQLIDELEAIENALTASFAIQSCQHFGNDCSNIVAEPLDTKGQIVHINGKTYIVLTISSLGLTVNIEIPFEMLRRIKPNYA